MLTLSHSLPISQVVAAKDRSNGREYAIKILDKKHIIKEKKVKYVNIEKNTLNKMNHPGIVRLYYTFQDHNSLCILLHLERERASMQIDSV
jgi:3-phosphoinositide dependent protein kinase-1